MERGYELWNTQGVEGMVREIWAEDVVLDEGGAFPDGVRVQGAEAVAARLRDRGAHMGDMHIDLEEVEVLGDRRTLTRVRVHIQGQGSGVAIDFPWWHLGTFDAGGRVTELDEFNSEEEARQAAALE